MTTPQLLAQRQRTPPRSSGPGLVRQASPSSGKFMNVYVASCKECSAKLSVGPAWHHKPGASIDLCPAHWQQLSQAERATYVTVDMPTKLGGQMPQYLDKGGGNPFSQHPEDEMSREGTNHYGSLTQEMSALLVHHREDINLHTENIMDRMLVRHRTQICQGLDETLVQHREHVERLMRTLMIKVSNAHAQRQPEFGVGPDGIDSDKPPPLPSHSGGPPEVCNATCSHCRRLLIPGPRWYHKPGTYEDLCAEHLDGLMTDAAMDYINIGAPAQLGADQPVYTVFKEIEMAPVSEKKTKSLEDLGRLTVVEEDKSTVVFPQLNPVVPLAPPGAKAVEKRIDSDVNSISSKKVSELSFTQDIYHVPSDRPDVPEGADGSPFWGRWVDEIGDLYGGAVIEICNGGWRPINPRGARNRDAIFTRTPVSGTKWELHEIRADGHASHFELRVSPTPGMLIINNTEGRAWNLRRAPETASDEAVYSRLVREASKPPPEDITQPLDIRVKSWMKDNKPVDFDSHGQARLWSITQSFLYCALRNIMIITDIALLVAETEYLAQQAASRGSVDSLSPGFMVVADIFCFLFNVDLACRLFAQGQLFWQAGKFGWHVYDVFVAVTYLWQVIAMHAFSNNPAMALAFSQLSALRLLNLWRMVQESDTVRKRRIFREFRLVVAALRSAFQALVWSSTLLVLTISMLSLVLVKAYLGLLNVQRQGEFYDARLDVCVPSAGVRCLTEDFGTLGHALLSIYKAISWGELWGDVYGLLTPFSWVYKLAFIGVQAFVFLALLNVITFVFIQSAMERVHDDWDLKAQNHRKAKSEFLDVMCELFTEVDTGRKRGITCEELRARMLSHNVGAYFASLGVDSDEAEHLLCSLDGSRSGYVDKERFISAFARMRGISTDLDIAAIQTDVQQVRLSVENLCNELGHTKKLVRHLQPRRSQTNSI